MEAIVLAGGFGTRLRQVVPDLPKPMAPIAGRPFLEILLLSLYQKGFSRVVLSLGFMAEKIIAHFGDRYVGMDLVYAVEHHPLGTGGAIRVALAQCASDHVFVFNGDTYLDLEVKTAGLQERRTFLQSRLTDVETRLNADVEARNAAAERRTKIEQGLTALVRLSAQVEKHSAALDARQNELQEARRRQSDEVRAISQRLDEARKERNASETALEERRERNRRVEVEEAEVRMRLEATIEALRRDHSVEPQVAVDSPMPELPENTSPITKVRELERELRLMGPINPLALEEFDELQKRHTFLEEQLEDVKNTRRELIKVIKQVDMEIQTTFAAMHTKPHPARHLLTK